MLSPATRRKLTVRIEGNRPAPAVAPAAEGGGGSPPGTTAEPPVAGTAAAAVTTAEAAAAAEASAPQQEQQQEQEGGRATPEAESGKPAAAEGSSPAVDVITDLYAFKRHQLLFPSLK